MKKLAILIIISIAFAACAPSIYKKWESEIAKDLTYAQVASDPDMYKGKTVYWGGVIVKTQNTEKGSVIEVLQKPVANYIPERTDTSQGRFLVNSSQFLDSAIYAPGRTIVVVGEILGSQKQLLDRMEYTYPLLKAKDIELIKRDTGGFRPGVDIGFGVLF